jgi:hypothetical protein
MIASEVHFNTKISKPSVAAQRKILQDYIWPISGSRFDGFVNTTEEMITMERFRSLIKGQLLENTRR